MNQRKMACFLAGLVLCTLFLSGCGARPAAAGRARYAPAAQKAAAEPLTGTLTVYLDRLYADELPDLPIRAALEAFETEHPGLTVEYISPAGGEERDAALARLRAEIEGGNGPDVFLLGWTHSKNVLFPDLQKAMRSGSFLDCKPLLAARGVQVDGGDFWPSVMAAGQIEGRQYVVPLSMQIPLAVAAAPTLEACGFDKAAAARDAAAFYAEAARVYGQTGVPLYNDVYQIENMTQPLLDYDNRDILLRTGTAARMMRLDRENFSAAWNRGTEDHLREYNQPGEDSFFCREGRRLADGQRLLNAAWSCSVIPVAWALAAQDVQTALLPVPNEAGGLTAQVDACAAVNASTGNPRAAAALIAWLLEQPRQDAAAWPGMCPSLAVRRESLAPCLESWRRFSRDIWWLDPSEEQRQLYCDYFGIEMEACSEAEKAAWKKGYGAPLRKAETDALALLCGGISTVHLQNPGRDTIDLGVDEDGRDRMGSLYDGCLEGMLTVEEWAAQLEPLLWRYIATP